MKITTTYNMAVMEHITEVVSKSEARIHPEMLTGLDTAVLSWVTYVSNVAL